MENCIFCKIAAGEIPSAKIYEDEKILCFKDIAPMAPVHLLVIPKEHIQSVDYITEENADIVAYIFTKIAEIAKKEGFAADGYRIITNVGDDGCQSVKHMHFHSLGGRKLPESLA